jgi:predicted esterase YcpF (UPF0227 family)
VPSVLYFHGFASSPNSAKVRSLVDLLTPLGITLNAPDLNAPSFERLDFEAMVQTGLRAASAIPPVAIAGSSLGALVALEVIRRGLKLPLVLIAPALGVSERWRSGLSAGDPIMVFNHARGTEAPIHRAFFEQMSELDVQNAPPPVPLSIVMGRLDETVPFQGVHDTWRTWEADGGLIPGSRFIEIAGGDHGLTAHVGVIAREIAAAVGR